MNDQDIKIQELDNKLALLGEQVASLKTLQENKIVQLFQPLSAETKRSIAAQIYYPITISLRNTDPATAANYSTFFVAERPYTIHAVTEIHGTAGSDAGAVTLQLERLQGTEALDAGDELLSTALSLKATANTVQYGALKSTDVVTLYRGDRLALKDAGTLTAIANLTVAIVLRPI